VVMPNGVAFAAVSSKFRHTCALSTTNQAYCWGFNDNAELGTNDVIARYVPTPVVNGSF